MPQQNQLPPIGADVSTLMPAVGADVTSLMGGSPQAPMSAPATPQGSAVGRAVGGFVDAINPIPLIKTLGDTSNVDPKEAAYLRGAGAPPGLGNLVRGVVQAQQGEWQKAKEAYDTGHYGNAIMYALSTALPAVGPTITGLGERAQSGDWSGAAGGAAALAVPLPVRGATRAAAVTAPSKLGTLAERASVRRMTEAIAPKGQTAFKRRMQTDAEAVAPTLAREPGMGAASRTGLADKVNEKLTVAEEALDAAADARNAGRAQDTAPIIKELKRKRQALSAEAVEGSQPTPTITERASPILDERGKPIVVQDRTREPLGRSVVPEHNRTRVAQIDKAISELEALGPLARYEALRRIRKSYDDPAKAVYSPSMTDDYLNKRGESKGAADVTGALRDAMAGSEPATAKANKDYALWRKASDVLEAAEQTERATPKVLRGVLARGAGATAGAVAGGGWGGVLGALLMGGVEKAAGSGITTKIAAARMLARVADGLKAGKQAQFRSALIEFGKLTGQSAKVNALFRDFQDQESR